MDKLHLHIKLTLLGLLVHWGVSAQLSYLNLQQAECIENTIVVEYSNAKAYDITWESPEVIKETNNATLLIESDITTTITGSYSTLDSNLVINGDFEAQFEGFNTTYKITDDVEKTGFIAVDDNPGSFTSYFINKGDHTLGNGNMLIIDGDTFEDYFYQTTVAAEKESQYEISFWGLNIHEIFIPGDTSNEDKNPPIYRITINGKTMYDTILPMDTSWNEFSFIYKTENTDSIRLEISSQTGTVKKNDFAIDDVSIRKKTMKTEELILESCLKDGGEMEIDNRLLVFTPNGDGDHDEFIIDEMGIAQIVSLDGELIKIINTPGAWDGTDKNNNPVGAGYYAIVINNQTVLQVSLVK